MFNLALKFFLAKKRLSKVSGISVNFGNKYDALLFFQFPAMKTGLRGCPKFPLWISIAPLQLIYLFRIVINRAKMSLYWEVAS